MERLIRYANAHGIATRCELGRVEVLDQWRRCGPDGENVDGETWIPMPATFADLRLWLGY